MTTSSVTVSDTATLSEAPSPPMTYKGDPLLDSPVLSVAMVPKLWVTLSSGVVASVSLSRVYVAGAALAETILIDLTQSSAGIFTREIDDNARFRVVSRLGHVTFLHDVFTLSTINLDQVTHVVSVLNGLKVLETIASRFVYTLSLTQRLSLGSLAFTFLGGSGTLDALTFGDILTEQFQAVALASDTFSLGDLFGPSMLFRLDLAEGVDVTDAEVLRMIYTGDPLLDGIDLLAGFVDPGSGFTTWAINTRTSAVTEYQNYAFNSVAKFGRRYLGATSDGLYFLDGEQDGGVDIATRIKSGWMQLAGSKFTSFKAAYLGLSVKDDGRDFFLKLHAGDGREYVYAVVPNNMQTTKVNMGKGLRSRYFSFELVSVGADYSLDTVEFVPISSTRRV